MTTTKKWLYEDLKNEEIKKLIRSLERMPEWLVEQRERYFEEQRFAEAVFGNAVRQSGLLEKLKAKKN